MADKLHLFDSQMFESRDETRHHAALDKVFGAGESLRAKRRLQLCRRSRRRRHCVLAAAHGDRCGRCRIWRRDAATAASFAMFEQGRHRAGMLHEGEMVLPRNIEVS